MNRPPLPFVEGALSPPPRKPLVRVRARSCVGGAPPPEQHGLAFAPLGDRRVVPESMASASPDVLQFSSQVTAHAGNIAGAAHNHRAAEFLTCDDTTYCLWSTRSGELTVPNISPLPFASPFFCLALSGRPFCLTSHPVPSSPPTH